MINKSETPAGSRLAGVSWKSLDRTSTKNLTPSAHRAQHIIDVRGLLADLAAMLCGHVIAGPLEGEAS
jgi:hypothetical protein